MYYTHCQTIKSVVLHRVTPILRAACTCGQFNAFVSETNPYPMLQLCQFWFQYFHALVTTFLNVLAQNSIQVQAVVKANRANFEPLWNKPRNDFTETYTYNYIAGTTTPVNPCVAVTTWVVSANTWNVTCFGFLVYLFYLFLGSCPAHTSGRN